MTANVMAFSPRSRIGPPGSPSDRRIGPAILSTSEIRVRFGLASAFIWGMSVHSAAGALSTKRGSPNLHVISIVRQIGGDCESFF